MKRTLLNSTPLWTLIVAGMLAASPVLADKPGDKGGKQDKGGHSDKGNSGGKGNASQGDRNDNHQDAKDDRSHERPRENGYFDDRRRTAAHDYYQAQYRGCHCPPGLAKKHNGCMPPGQAKKWRVGYPLPRDVIYYEVPRSLVVQMGPPPSGYRYIRVASDLLLIAVGTSMVIDAMQDLGRM
jgi:Ni/Co efflux regulator RcnB